MAVLRKIRSLPKLSEQRYDDEVSRAQLAIDRAKSAIERARKLLNKSYAVRDKAQQLAETAIPARETAAVKNTRAVSQQRGNRRD